MATVDPQPYPMPEFKSGDDINKYLADSQKALDAIPEDKLFRVPYADGYAYYVVISEKPLVLRHVPYMDAWQLPAAYIKGLTLKNVRTNIQSNMLYKKLIDG